MRSQEVWRKTRGVAYDTAWPFIQDQGCERPACSVISCWFWRQDSHREEERTDLLRTRLSTHPSIASFVRNKPSHDFWHMKLYCFLPFQSLRPHSPPTHFSVLQLQDFPEHIMPFHIAMSLSIELHFRLSYCNKERLQQTVLVFLLKQPRGEWHRASRVARGFTQLLRDPGSYHLVTPLSLGILTSFTGLKWAYLHVWQRGSPGLSGFVSRERTQKLHK